MIFFFIFGNVCSQDQFNLCTMCWYVLYSSHSSVLFSTCPLLGYSIFEACVLLQILHNQFANCVWGSEG